MEWGAGCPLPAPPPPVSPLTTTTCIFPEGVIDTVPALLNTLSTPELATSV